MSWSNAKNAKGNDEGVVADYLARVFLIFPTRSFIKGLWWYDRIDDGTDPVKGGHHFGLFRNDHSEKPAICALREVSKLLATYKPISVQQQGKQIWIAKFSDSKGFLFAIWSETADVQPKVTIDTPQKAEITARGICRDVTGVASGTPPLSAVITGSPLLLFTSARSLTIKQ